MTGSRRGISRRQFLAGAALGGVAVGCQSSAGVVLRAAGGSRGSLRLLFYTDVHAKAEGRIPEALGRAARIMNEQRPDLAIAGGDLIADGFHSTARDAAASWQTYVAMEAAIRADTHAVIGNHDLVAASPRDVSEAAADPRAAFLEVTDLPRTFYSFDALDYHFVVLDSVALIDGVDGIDYEGFVNSEQLEWLEEDLSRIPPGRPIVLATHLPLLTTLYGATAGSHLGAPRDRVVVNGAQVLDLFGGHNLVLALQGHLHVAELLYWRGTTFVTGGAVCGNWWRGPRLGTKEGFSLFTFRHDTIHWQYLDYGWDASSS